MNIIEQLRNWACSVRRKPTPLSEAIPMVTKAADEIERLQRERDALAEAIHNSCVVSGITVGDVDLSGPQLLLICKNLGQYAKELHQDVEEMREQRDRAMKVLHQSREALQFANDSPNGPITDTIWMMHTPETLFDYMDNALNPIEKEIQNS